MAPKARGFRELLKPEADGGWRTRDRYLIASRQANRTAGASPRCLHEPGAGNRGGTPWGTPGSWAIVRCPEMVGQCRAQLPPAIRRSPLSCRMPTPATATKRAQRLPHGARFERSGGSAGSHRGY